MAWEVKIHIINIGQGDCSIIEAWDKPEMLGEDVLKAKKESYDKTPKEYQAVLIDGGKASNDVDQNDNKKFNYIEILEYCSENKIYLTKVLVTHADEDHYGGVLQLINACNWANLVFVKLLILLETENIEDDRLEKNLAEIFKVKEGVKEVKIKLEKVKEIIKQNKNNNTIEDQLDSLWLNSKGYEELFLEWDESLSNSWGAYCDEEIYFPRPYTVYISQNAITSGNKELKELISNVVLFKNDTFEEEPEKNKLVTIGNEELGIDIFGFNNDKLKKYETQKEEEKPGLFVVASNGEHHTFEAERLIEITKTNASSIGLLLVHGEHTYLTCGDLEDQDGNNTEESDIIRKDLDLTKKDLESILAKKLYENGYTNLTGMKLGHHGGAHASSSYVLEQLNPSFVTISCGGNFQHGHPTRNVIHRLYGNKKIKRIYFTNSGSRYGVKKSWNSSYSDFLGVNDSLLDNELLPSKVAKKQLSGQFLRNVETKLKEEKELDEKTKKFLKELKGNNAISNLWNLYKAIDEYVWLEKLVANKKIKTIGGESFKKYFKGYILDKKIQNQFLKINYNNKGTFSLEIDETGEDKKVKTLIDKSEVMDGCSFNLKDDMMTMEEEIASMTVTIKKKAAILKTKTKPSSKLTKRRVESGSSRNRFCTKKLSNGSTRKPKKALLVLKNSSYSSLINAFLQTIPSLKLPDLIKKYIIETDTKASINYIAEKKESWRWVIPDMPNVQFAITRLDFNGELKGEKPNSYYNFIATAQGTLFLNNKDTNTLIDLKLNTSNLESYWEASLKQKATIITGASIMELATIANTDFMPYHIPTSLTPLIKNATPSINLVHFDAIFYANPDFPSSLDLDIGIDKNWEILPNNKLSVNAIGFKFQLEPDSITGSIYGAFNLENTKVQIGLAMDTEQQWSVSLSGEQKEDGTYEALPSLEKIGSLFIDDFKNVAIPFLDATNNALEITLVQMQLGFYKSPKVLKLGVNTKINIKGLAFNVLIQVHPKWAIKGALDTSKGNVSLKSIFKNFGIKTFHKGIGDVSISNASIEAQPSINYYKIGIGLEDITDFKIGEKTQVLLESVFLEIKDINKSIQGVLAAEILVKESSIPKTSCNAPYETPAIFELKAFYAANIWSFEGDLTGDITFTEFINWLTSKFDIKENELPQWLLQLHLSNISISFSIAGDISFSLDLYTYLSENKQKRLQFDLELSKGKNKNTFELQGSVSLGNYSFSIDFSSGIDSSFRAQMKTKEGLSIKTLITLLGIEDSINIPEFLNILFNEISLEYDFGAEKKLSIALKEKGTYEANFISYKPENKWMYAFYIKVNEVDINLDSLPLVGGQLKKIGVNNVGFLLLSTALTSKEAKKINIDGLIIPKGNDDNKPDKKTFGLATLQCTLQILEHKYPINVSVGNESKTDETHNKFEKSQAITLNQKKEGNPITWKKIGKSIGPFALNKIGFEFKKDILTLHFDAELTVGPVKIGLNDLWLSSPITEFNPNVGLNGLNISYNTPLVKIGGSFAKEKPTEDIVYLYNGAALIGVKALSISAMGSYAKLKSGDTSMFLYALMTDPPLGGIPEFFITGLSAGFGYNRDLKLPDVDDVKEFPFVSPFVSSSSVDKPTPIEALKVLTEKDLVPIDVGQQWLVAGVRFSTYKLLESIGLISIKFGAKMEIGLTGLSSLLIPKKAETPLVMAELALDARILPIQGKAYVNGKLTPESYIFTKECKLTGGFAFQTWFGNNDHNGDFVVTLGGYHPKFKIPSHYPQVPRLGFKWTISSELSLSGELYFALTPSCIMVGGKLNAIFQAGAFKAWFEIKVNFMILWKPYFYEADISATFHASYTFKVDLYFKTITKTISGSYGANLSVWGPDFSGNARIDLFVISFPLSFGVASKNSVRTIGWTDFKNSFLPTVHSKKSKISKELTQPSASIKTDTYINIKVTSGIKLTNKNSEDSILVLQNNVVFEIDSLIPIFEAEYLFNTNIGIPSEYSSRNKELGIAMVGVNKIDISKIVIKIEHTNHNNSDNTINYFRITEKYGSVPKSLWGGDTNHKAPSVIKDVFKGVRIESKVNNPIDGLKIEKSKLKFAVKEPITVTFSRPKKTYLNKSVNYIETINSENTKLLRNDMLGLFKENKLISNEVKIELKNSSLKNFLKGEPIEEIF